MSEHHRKSDSWWFRSFVVAFLLGFLGQGLVTWRTIGVVENDIKHLTAAVVTMQDDVKELFRRAYWDDE